MNESKQIVFFTGNLSQGGAERVISILANRMSDKGESVSVLLYQDKEIFYKLNSGVSVVSVERESGTGNLITNMLWIRRYVKNKAHIVVSFLAVFNMVMIIATLGLQCPIIVADRNDPRHVPDRFVLRVIRNILYRFADGIVLQTTQSRNYFSKRIISRSTVIPNPVELGDKCGLGLRTDKRNEIITVGRLMPQKNHTMLIEVFAKISERYPEYSLKIYGEGPERNHIESVAKQLGIDEKICLPGNVKNIFEEIAQAEIFVLTSVYEGMPNALIEAMCIGLPCISTDVYGARDLIRDGENGYIVDIDDKEMLEERLCDLLSNKVLRDQMAQKAVNVYNELNADRIVDRWHSFIINNMMEDKHPCLM